MENTNTAPSILDMDFLLWVQSCYMGFPGDARKEFKAMGVSDTYALAWALSGALKSGNLIKMYQDYGLQPEGAAEFQTFLNACWDKYQSFKVA